MADSGVQRRKSICLKTVPDEGRHNKDGGLPTLLETLRLQTEKALCNAFGLRIFKSTQLQSR